MCTERFEDAHNYFAFCNYCVWNGWGVVREPGHAKHGGSARFPPEVDPEVCAARIAVAMDVGGRRNDGAGIFLVAGDFVVSRREFCGAGERIELCSGGIRGQGISGRENQPESLVGNCGGVHWGDDRVV